MDFGDKDNSNNNEMWEWPGEEYSLQTDSRNDFSHFLWDEVNTNEDDLLYMLEEQTPIKDCAEFGYQVSDVGDNANKGLEEIKESSQLKRRRMLQFTLDSNEADIANEQGAAAFLKSKVRECSMVEDGLSESLQWTSQWAVGFSDERCALSCEGLDQSSEGWLMECLNEKEMRCSPDEMNNYVAYNEQVSVSECNNISPDMETDVVQETPAPAPPRIFKGRKSYMKTPTKLTTSVAYPFSLIKPCGVQGDVTLNDINQRILAPPPSRLKHKKDEDPAISYPTSAYSGKPVVVKTKIRTEGGKGSITIMRTKG
ncbi:protein XRI1-like [Phoenix dactylifera]|uniref:Protein XRI1-like n=1 Tax=Phoenix dactylifera TaxID=42345 RepID=A0A8B9APD2_PHODC|nr:protein XRI1-like [Phoenix dactylifera]